MRGLRGSILVASQGFWLSYASPALCSVGAHDRALGWLARFSGHRKTGSRTGSRSEQERCHATRITTCPYIPQPPLGDFTAKTRPAGIKSASFSVWHCRGNAKSMRSFTSHALSRTIRRIAFIFRTRRLRTRSERRDDAGRWLFPTHRAVCELLERRNDVSAWGIVWPSFAATRGWTRRA